MGKAHKNSKIELTEGDDGNTVVTITVETNQKHNGDESYEFDGDNNDTNVADGYFRSLFRWFFTK